MNFCQTVTSLMTSPKFKFGVKLALVSGAAYYVAEQGVWKDSDTTVKLCNKLKTEVAPYTNEITKQIPYELPSLPSTNQTSYLFKYYWNVGVKATFSFLVDLPDNVSYYSAAGYKSITESEQFKNMFTQQTAKPEEKVEKD